MKMMLRPASRSRRSTPNRRSTSGGDSAEVGSSRMMMRAPENSTRESSTSCCKPSGSAPIGVRGSTAMPRLSRCSARAAPHRAPVHQAEPVERLDAHVDVLRDAQRAARRTAPDAPCRSPRRARRAARRSARARPSSRISPSYSGCTPAMIFISVDLPAPFSPTRPWISPAFQREIDLAQRDAPPNALEIRSGRAAPDHRGTAPAATLPPLQGERPLPLSLVGEGKGRLRAR